jgi:hypothetical protein
MSDYVRHPLDPCFARVRRADEHLVDLKRLFAEVQVRQANAVEIEFDPNPPYSILGAKQPPETFIGMNFPIRIGEICYNLRSALDYVIFELAKLDSGVEQSGTQFPIMDAEQDFEGRGKGAFLKGVNLIHVARIERLQPYTGCNWTRNLRDTSNPDKHRHFLKMKGDVTATVHSSLDRSTDLSRIIGYERNAPHPTLGPVKVKVHLATSLAFTDGTPVTETLEEIKSEVASTLRYFKSEFREA